MSQPNGRLTAILVANYLSSNISWQGFHVLASFFSLQLSLLPKITFLMASCFHFFLLVTFIFRQSLDYCISLYLNLKIHPTVTSNINSKSECIFVVIYLLISTLFINSIITIYDFDYGIVIVYEL